MIRDMSWAFSASKANGSTSSSPWCISSGKFKDRDPGTREH